jgi:cardiolipin synthase
VAAFLPVNPLARRWSVHLRNHRKMVVVDGRIGFTGGMNVGDEYSGRARWKGNQFFHDTHLALHGPAVWDLGVIFSEDWRFATGERIELPPQPAPEPEGSVVAVVPSGPDQRHNANALAYFAGIASARHRCWLQSPYFIPDEPTAQALITAALRGVDVRVLVPARCDVKLVGRAARSYYRALLRGGVRIFEFEPSMLHAKAMVVDGSWCLIGSANIDIRSFRLNFELGALIVDGAFAAHFESHFEEDLADSREVKRAALARIGLLDRLRDGVARLLSPLL